MNSNINDLICEVLVGKHKEIHHSLFNKTQMKMGKAVEREHTNDPKQASEIAKDHLAEIPDYYTRLKKMEKSAGQK